MTDQQLDQLGAILKALTNPTRLRVILLLQAGELSVTQICQCLNVERAYISHMLAKLMVLGLLQTRRAGKQVFYSTIDSKLIDPNLIERLSQPALAATQPSQRPKSFPFARTMTKQDVISQISQHTGQDPLTSRAVIESFFKVVKHRLADGESIHIRGFGSFVPVPRAAKVARNIAQNTAHPIEAHVFPTFKPSAEFKEQVRVQLVTKITK